MALGTWLDVTERLVTQQRSPSVVEPPRSGSAHVARAFFAAALLWLPLLPPREDLGRSSGPVLMQKTYSVKSLKIMVSS